MPLMLLRSKPSGAFPLQGPPPCGSHRDKPRSAVCRWDFKKSHRSPSFNPLKSLRTYQSPSWSLGSPGSLSCVDMVDTCILYHGIWVTCHACEKSGLHSWCPASDVVGTVGK